MGELEHASVGNKSQTWLLLLHKDAASKTALDCALCRTALPMLKRTAARLEAANVHVGWMNCSSSRENVSNACDVIADPVEDKASSEWGALRLLHFAGGPPTSTGLWNTQLLAPGEMTRDSLLAALEAAA